MNIATWTRKMKTWGFTLMEVLIATLIFSIGMMAVMSMEFSAISAYNASKNRTIATELGYRFISVLRVEAANWSTVRKDMIIDNAVDESSVPIGMNRIYLSPVGTSGMLLGDVLNDPWEWQVLTPDPIDTALNSFTSNGRYCAFMRGDNSTDVFGGVQANLIDGTTQDVSPVIKVQVAVVYAHSGPIYDPDPTNPGDFTCQNLPGCTGVTSLLLRPDGVASGSIPLAECGYGAVYMGAVISRSNG